MRFDMNGVDDGNPKANDNRNFKRSPGLGDNFDTASKAIEHVAEAGIAAKYGMGRQPRQNLVPTSPAGAFTPAGTPNFFQRYGSAGGVEWDWLKIGGTVAVAAVAVWFVSKRMGRRKSRR